MRIIVITESVVLMDHFWIWLIAGLVPYSITWKSIAGERVLRIRALFWYFEVQQNKRHCEWIVRIPFIEQLRQ